MAQAQKVYLDDQGNEIRGTGAYLDPTTGELVRKPITSGTAAQTGRLALGPTSISADSTARRLTREAAGTLPDFGEGVGAVLATPSLLAPGAAPLVFPASAGAGRALGSVAQRGVLAAMRPPWMAPPDEGVGSEANQQATQGITNSALGLVGGEIIGTLAGGMPKPPTASYKPFRAINEILSPRNADLRYDASLPTTTDLVLEQARIEGRDAAKPVNGLVDMVGLLERGRDRIMAVKDQFIKPFEGSITVNNDGAVGKSIRQSITAKMRREAPQEAARIEAIASQYDRPISLRDAEQLLADTNKELAPYFNKDVLDRADAATKQAYARNLALRKNLSRQMYDAVNKVAGPGVAEIQRVWGNTNDILEYAIPLSRSVERFGIDRVQDKIVEGTLDTAAGAMYSKAGAAVRAGRAVKNIMQGNLDDRLAKAFGELAESRYPYRTPSPDIKRPTLMLPDTGETTPITAMPANIERMSSVRGARRETGMAPRRLTAPPAPDQGIAQSTVQTRGVGQDYPAPRGLEDIGAMTRSQINLADPTNARRAVAAASLSDVDLGHAIQIAQRQFPDALPVLQAEAAKRAALRAQPITPPPPPR